MPTTPSHDAAKVGPADGVRASAGSDHRTSGASTSFAAYVPESGDRVEIYGKSATVISAGKRYVTVQIDGDEDGPSNWHPSYLKKLLPCGHKQSDLTEGGQYGPFCAVCAVTKPGAREQLEKLVVAFHERWYPQLAWTAIGEKQLGHEQSAERWGELCKDWFEIVEHVRAGAYV